MKKVNVLLSAYNGAKYIEEQLESILGQDYENLEIYVRDDGSKDGTGVILRKYEGKIKCIYGENKGFVASFLELVRVCGDADYYAFADQDDVWKGDKISRAVDALEKEPDETPVLYCSNFEICDENLNVREVCSNLHEPFTIEKTIVNGQTGFGVTQVFNHAAREMIKNHQTPALSRVFGHDTWLHMVCLCFGKIVYDKEPTLYYRRHGNNVSSQEYQGGSKVTHQVWRIRQFLFKSEGKNVYLDAEEFRSIFREELSEQQKKTIDLYIRERGIAATLKKVFYTGRYRADMADEVLLRILFLIHKM